MRTLPDSFRHAVLNLWAHKLRTGLAVLGVVIGSAAVVALLSGGILASRQVMAQFESLGTDLLNVSLAGQLNPDQPADPPLSAAAVQAALQTVRGVQAAAPTAPVSATVSERGRRLSAHVLAVDEGLARVATVQLAAGRFLSHLDQNSLYCVIGEGVARQLRQQGVRQPLGYTLQVGPQLLTVVGVLAKSPDNMFMRADLNRTVLVTFPGAAQLQGELGVSAILLKLSPGMDYRLVQRALLRQLYQYVPNQRIYVHSPKALLTQMRAQQRTLSWLLGLVGGVSLLVGGIGIMNILLVSVIERQREIGLRLAVGATPKAIGRLFLVESLVMTGIGGLCGGLIGEAIVWLLAQFASWPFALLPLPLLIGIGVSCGVGLFFGVFPARQSARVEPIVALRDM